MIVDENIGFLGNSIGKWWEIGGERLRRGLLWSDCGVVWRFDSGLRGAVGMNWRRGGVELNEYVSFREVGIYSEGRELISTKWGQNLSFAT